MYPKKACIDAVSQWETERKSGVKQIGLVGARAVCGSDSCWAVSRGNQTSLCGSLFRQSTQQQKALATRPFTGSLHWPCLAWLQSEQPVSWKSSGFTALQSELLWIYFTTNPRSALFSWTNEEVEMRLILLNVWSSTFVWEWRENLFPVTAHTRRWCEHEHCLWVFGRRYLEGDWGVGEGLEGQGLCCLFSSLNAKSCVVTPSPDDQ